MALTPPISRLLRPGLPAAAAALLLVCGPAPAQEEGVPAPEPMLSEEQISADPPATGPATRPTRPWRRGEGLTGRGLREREIGEFRGGDVRQGFNAENQVPPTAEEWTFVRDFAREHLPNRWALYEEVLKARGENAPSVQAIRQRLTNRHRTLMRAVQGDRSRFFDTAIEYARQEDDAWGDIRRLKADPQNQELRQQVREKVQGLVTSLLDERSQRLEYMRRTLEDEEAAIASARENLEQIIDNHMNLMLDDPSQDQGFRGERRGDGERRGSRRGPRGD